MSVYVELDGIIYIFKKIRFRQVKATAEREVTI